MKTSETDKRFTKLTLRLKGFAYSCNTQSNDDVIRFGFALMKSCNEKQKSAATGLQWRRFFVGSLVG